MATNNTKIKKNQKKVLSSALGKISELLLVYDRNSSVYDNFLKELIKKMPSYTKFFIWVNSGQDKQDLEQILINECGIKNRQIEKPIKSFPNNNTNTKVYILQNGDYFQFSKWIQDPILVFADPKNQHPNKRYLLELDSNTIGDILDYKFNDNFDNQNFIKWLILDGGNLLVEDDYVFVGANDFYRISEKLKMISGRNKKIKKSEVREKIAHLLGRPKVVEIDPLKKTQSSVWDMNNWSINEVKDRKRSYIPRQPEAHLDMFMTVMGQRKILLAKPDFSLIDQNPNPNLEKDFNKIEKDLSKRGFEVLRNPMPVFKNSLGNETKAFYNNCLVEVYEIDEGIFSKKVWLPKYGSQYNELMPFDKKNQKIWEDCGFEVSFIETDFISLSEQEGALHCLIKTLKRN